MPDASGVKARHPFPDFELRSEKWLGVSFGVGRFPGNPYDVPLIGFVFDEHEYAVKINKLILGWTDGERVDESKRVRLAVIEDSPSSYIFFCHPNSAYTVFCRSAEEASAKGGMPEREAMMFFLGKRCDMGEESRYRWFRDRYQDGVPVLLEFSVANKDTSLSPALGAISIIVFDVKFAKKDELDQADPLYGLLRTMESSTSSAPVDNRAFLDYGLEQESGDGSADKMRDPVRRINEYSRELFALFEEFFLRATGKSAANFATVETFPSSIRANAHELVQRGRDAFCWLDTEIREFHARNGVDAFIDAKHLGGMRLVLGGSSRFLRSQLNSVSTAALYSDTVLIPDPVMPWLETNRSEERFRHVLPLQMVHALLHLKPLVDADLPYPPLVVFPSWERLLEINDTQTQDGISQLITDVLAASLGESLSDFREAIDFADRDPARFCEMVDRHHLFVAPGGSCDEPLGKALGRYEEWLATWRSRDWLNGYYQLATHRRVLTGIKERITPLYHLLENTQEFQGHPLMCLEQHAHYFRLVSQASSALLGRLGVLNPKTTAMVNALGSRRLRWLGGIPIDTLVRLRLDNENAAFRNRLAAAVGRLHDSALADVNRVAAEVCHSIEEAIVEHEKEMRTLQKKYNRVHGQTAVLALAAAGAALIPALAPFLGSAAPLVLATKYGHDKVAELGEKRTLTQSLVGVLAVTKSKD